MSDISALLEIIRTNPYGESVKTAIRDALAAIAETRGGDQIEEFEHGQILESPMGSYDECVAGSYNDAGGIIFVQENNDDAKTEATLTITVPSRSYLVASAMHRSTPLSISGDGWTTIGTAGPTGTYSQCLTAYGKIVESGTYTVKFTQPESVRLSAKLIVFPDITGLTLVETYSEVGAASHTFPAKSNKKRLYLASSSLARGSIISVGFSGFPATVMDELRYSAFYSYLNDNSVESISYTNPGYTSDLNALVFDIN